MKANNKNPMKVAQLMKYFFQKIKDKLGKIIFLLIILGISGLYKVAHLPSPNIYIAFNQTIAQH